MSLITATPTATLFNKSPVVASKPVADIHLVVLIVGAVAVAFTSIVFVCWYFIVWRHRHLDVSQGPAQGESAKTSNIDLEAQAVAADVSVEAVPEAQLEIIVVPTSRPEQPTSPLMVTPADTNMASTPPLPEISVGSVEEPPVIADTKLPQPYVEMAEECLEPAPESDAAPELLISAFQAAVYDDDDDSYDDDTGDDETVPYPVVDEGEVQIRTLDVMRIAEVTVGLPSVESQHALVEEWVPPAPASPLQEEAPAVPEASPAQCASGSPSSSSHCPSTEPRPPLASCQPSSSSASPSKSSRPSSGTSGPSSQGAIPMPPPSAPTDMASQSLGAPTKRKSVTWAPDGQLELIRVIQKAIYHDYPVVRESREPPAPRAPPAPKPSTLRRSAAVKAQNRRPTSTGIASSPPSRSSKSSSTTKAREPCSDKAPPTTIRRTPAIKDPVRRPSSTGSVPATQTSSTRRGSVPAPAAANGRPVKRSSPSWR